jgi:putative glutathione S-transferase
MGQLVNGEWRSGQAFASASGEFIRQSSSFRDWISADGSSGFAAEPGRYHLYVARACPWCHRTLIYRALKKLEDIVSVSYVEPLMLDEGWVFSQPDPLTGSRRVYELYRLADPHYTGRTTVPVLWDKHTRRIVNNESADIIRMLNSAFDSLTREHTDYYPPALRKQIDEINARVYDTVNNGVYRAGFATSQAAYASAARALFASLDWLEERLAQSRYLLGDVLTEADLRLFPTLVRFDAVYYGHFKCNLRHVYEYPALWDFTRELYQMPGIAQTVAIDEYKTHYYGSHRHMNPAGIVPLGPVLDFASPHGRDRLGTGRR